MVKQVEINQRVRGMAYYDGIAGHHQLASMFTAEEVLCFMLKESLIQDMETVGIDLAHVTDALVERLAQNVGFTKVDVLERMVQAAFGVFAPGLPVIPSERVLKVVEFRRIQKLGKVYGLASSLPWTTLRRELNLRRCEIISVYRSELTADARIYLRQRKPFQPGLEDTRIEYQQDHGIRSSEAETVRSTQDQMSRVTTVDSCSSLHRSLIPVYHPQPGRHVATANAKECQSPHVSEISCSFNRAQIVVRDSYPTPPEDDLQDSHPPRPSLVPRGNIINQTRIPEFVSTRKRGRGRLCEVARTHRVHPSKQPKGVATNRGSTSRHQQQGSPKRQNRAFPHGASIDQNLSRISFSLRTDVCNLLQLAQSPEESEENGKLHEDMRDDWSNSDESSSHPIDALHPPASLRDSGSTLKESPTTITLRKLAELLEQNTKAKQSQGMIQQQRQDNLMTSLDSDYTVEEACHSPHETRRTCLFTFKGCRLEAPATAKCPAQHKTPVWHEREDPGTPTPIRTSVPPPKQDVFCLGKAATVSPRMSPGPGVIALYGACDEEDEADMLPMVTKFVTLRPKARVFFGPK